MRASAGTVVIGNNTEAERKRGVLESNLASCVPVTGRTDQNGILTVGSWIRSWGRNAMERAESLRSVRQAFILLYLFIFFREIAGLTGSPATETTDAGPGSSSAPTTSSPTPRVSEAATNGETGANEQKKNQTTTEGQ